MSGGFDALVGNPPWVSYAGKAAQPLHAPTRTYFMTFYEAFAGFRNLQGLFVERCAHLLRIGGRLGLVIPSSMSEQDGYMPTRVAHDRHCVCDSELPDFGDSFAGVFQPSMLLRSTRRPGALAEVDAEPWPMERPDLDPVARRLIAKMACPPLPGDLFGERGLQSSGEDTEHLADVADERHTVPLRVGGDIEPFLRRPPSQFADPGWFGERLRPAREWADVRILIRQTARFPKAVLSDGAGFRNSLLAGFETDEYPAAFLVTYLNSTPIRWLHYVRHRDARQGMPQMKIGHLRRVPSPARDLVEQLAGIGRELSVRNAGLPEDKQDLIDNLVANAFGLAQEERDLQRAWAVEVK